MTKRTKAALFVGIPLAQVIIALSLFYCSYSLTVKPWLAATDDIIQNTHELHRNPPELVRDLLAFQPFDKLLQTQLKKWLMKEFNMINVQSMVSQINLFFWLFTFDKRYDTDATLTLWLHFAPYEKGRGLNNAALHHFGRELDDLSIEELYRIIYYTVNPPHFDTHPEEFRMTVDAMAQWFNDTRNVNE